MAGPAAAAPGDHGKGVGGCVDQFHGNATNPRPSGHGVLPSQSPGPWVNVPTDPENPIWGQPLGYWVSTTGATPADAQEINCP
jgi:hypothetical protein